jgi:CBS domain-containing protein
MKFDHAKNNFLAAARYGLQARMTWIEGEKMGASRLILEKLAPAARKGLSMRGIRQRDIDRYIGVIEARVASGMNGSQWVLESLAAMEDFGNNDQRYRALTASMLERQLSGNPVHTWRLADPDNLGDWRDNYRTVEQIMTSDLFTVDAEDLVDLAANLMDWEHIRHVPVEDNDGRLVGLVSHRQMLRIVGQGIKKDGKPVAVREIMTPSPITVTPETTSLDAIKVMRKHGVGCLPVVGDDNKLVGIVTEFDFLNAAAALFEEQMGGR